MMKIKKILMNFLFTYENEKRLKINQIIAAAREH